MAAVAIHISPHSMGMMPPVVKSRVNSTKAVSVNDRNDEHCGLSLSGSASERL